MAANGGHVKRRESPPVETVRRQVQEELGIQARFPTWIGERALLVTMTETVGSMHERHTDVRLRFDLKGNVISV